MLDAYILEGALSPSAERELLAKITDLLLELSGPPVEEPLRQGAATRTSSFLRACSLQQCLQSIEHPFPLFLRVVAGFC